jgi:type IV pilus biogenesis protein CpaD/CtpE
MGGKEMQINRESDPMTSNKLRILVVAASAVLAGCSTTPPPIAEMAAAKAAVERAEQPAARHAPDELLAAQRKLTAAQAALRSEDFERARRLAEEAEMDARLALAIAESTQARQSLEQVREGIATLKQELQRRQR